MKKLKSLTVLSVTLLLLGMLCVTHLSLAQTGSAGSPFTALGQARNVTTPGIYYFNIGGTSFSTYVNNGWVLVANDSGGATTVLPKSTAMNSAARGILPASVLAKFITATSLQVSTSDGIINCTTSNTEIISRMVSDSALFMGTYSNDKANNATWTGTGQSYVRGAGASCAGTSLGAHLDSCLFWPCGDGNGMHWIPSGGYHHESWGFGEAPNTVAFTLWTEATLVALPVTISSFQGMLLENNTIRLNWTSEGEADGQYLAVQRSADGSTGWTDLAKFNASGNLDQSLSNSTIDTHPNAGNNYYRLEVVGAGGEISYSQIILVINPGGNQPTLYPNPLTKSAILQGQGLSNLKIYSVTGQDVTAAVKRLKESDMKIALDFALVPRGIYFIKADHFLVKAVVE